MAGGLTARKVEIAKAGKYSDGGNLYLIVSPSGSRKWVLALHLARQGAGNGARERE